MREGGEEAIVDLAAWQRRGMRDSAIGQHEPHGSAPCASSVPSDAGEWRQQRAILVALGQKIARELLKHREGSRQWLNCFKELEAIAKAVGLINQQIEPHVS